MSIKNVKEYLKQFGVENKIREFDVSSATVELASIALGCEPARIAKSLTFDVNNTPIIIVTAGDAKIDNSKFKQVFSTKAKMLTYEEVEDLIGHKVGGVCPFAINDNVKVYLDISLKRFSTVFPACGSSNSAIELTINELEQFAKPISYIDVCKNWE